MLKYTIKNDIQHVLDCSDVYIGDTDITTRKDYIFDSTSQKIINSTITTPEALIRIFIEVLTNAVDNAERSKLSDTKCKSIKVNINLETGLTSVWNDGLVVPVCLANDAGCESETFIHSLIFGHFRSSSNYETEKSLLSGKNGVGVKCTNIFSKFFSVTGVDPLNKLKFYQEWTNNMTGASEPKITTCDTNGYTEVKYIPDFKRFNLTKYPDEMYCIVKKLVIDTSALLPEINFYFNGEKIMIKSLLDYANLYYNVEPKNTLSLSHKNSDVVIVGSETPLQPISFVNGQITSGGGQHVQSWTKALFSGLILTLNRNKRDIKFTKADLSPYFQFFIHSRVNKPKFDGQNKNVLKTPKVESTITSSHLNKILKWDVVTTIQSRVFNTKELLALKKIEGTKRKTMVNIEGYDQANKLGPESVLIVCEGLSAKSYAVAGIQTGILHKKGRNFFGILPLRGKFLNVKNVNTSKITNNKVVSDLIKVLGIKFNVDYSKPQNFKNLNYGTLLILTDADKDGIHIEGLILNFFAELFPSLIEREGFIISMKTPIVKINSNGKLFFDENAFEKYRQNHPQLKKFKYYKGLGTIGPSDTPLFFGKKILKFKYDEQSESSINKVFKNDNSNERKLWLSLYNPKNIKFSLDSSTSTFIDFKISDFMEHEMVKFSYEDCKRSIGNVVDGLKESQRKVIYAIRKKFKSKKDFIKVAQLSGYVAEQTDYKHGEQNLCETIIKFAQDFVGSNNIALLEPDGQFGTRLEGGKDSANSRYIYTRPSEILKYIFREEDDPILKYTSEGEPDIFVPIIPLVLVNGCLGIGTGWSCFIPQFNPLEIIDFLYKKLSNSQECTKLQLIPYYKNFKGKIKQVNPLEWDKFITYGKMKQVSENLIKVSELPVGMWTDRFKEQCYSLIEKELMLKVTNESTTTDVNFTLHSLKDISLLKMTTNLHTTNMVLFNGENVITKFDTINDILEEFYKVRLNYYHLRKEHSITSLKNQINLSENKLRFILKVVNDKSFLNKCNDEINQELEGKFTKVDNTFNYLLNISIRECTQTSVKALTTTIAKLKKELDILNNLTVQQIWMKELDELREHV
jgi:DNA topoisomerase-2